MSNQIENVSAIIPQDFFVDKGLYVPYSFSLDDIQTVMKITCYKESVDCYCIECGQKSIFKSTYRSSPNMMNPTSNPDKDKITYSFDEAQIAQVKFACSRNAKHNLFFIILLDKGIISKIGQSPSYADITLKDIDKYKKILPNDLFIEFKKSIGLYTHGVGAGSVVYLRRIIEKFMIEPAYKEAMNKSDWNEEEYKKARVRERMDMLSDYLPPFLVKNSIIYGIVSKGIHELDEKECIQHYPVLKSFIEVVLTDMKNKKDDEEARRKLEADLSSIAGKI